MQRRDDRERGGSPGRNPNEDYRGERPRRYDPRYRSEDSYRDREDVRQAGAWSEREGADYEPNYSRGAGSRGYGQSGYGQSGRDRISERERGYGAGVSGQYFTRGGQDEHDQERDFDDARFAGQYGQHDVNQDRFDARWGAGNSGFESSGYGSASYGGSERYGSSSHGASNYGQARRGPERDRYDRGGYGTWDDNRQPQRFGNRDWGDYPSRDYGQRETRGSYGNRGVTANRGQNYFVGGLQQGGFVAPSNYTEGSHYGRGPKGYTRSDDRIRDDLCERLHDDDDVDASDVSIIVKEGEVTLIGSVETRRQKHRTEDIADAVPGVRDVHNQLRVTKGMMSQLADKVQSGVERLTGENRNEQTRQNPNGIGTTTNRTTSS